MSDSFFNDYNMNSKTWSGLQFIKGILHFEINVLYVSAYLKGIQDVGDLVSTVFSILIFLGQTILVCQSYNGGLWGSPWVHLKEHAQRTPN